MDDATKPSSDAVPADPRSVRRAIASIASRQHGVVARRQLLSAGVPEYTVDRRAACGRLRPVHRGVYVVGPLVASRAPEMAATLACGPTAAVSHRSAAALWELARPRARGTPVEVQVVGPARRRPGIRVHRTTRRDPNELVRLDGIPVTSPARTILDLAGGENRRVVERALATALEREIATRDEVAALRLRYAGRRGTALLGTLLRGGRPALTRSEAEQRLLTLVRDARLPPPEVNARLGPYEVDFHWPDRRVVVEIDGFAFHSSRSAFERDRERDGTLAARGIRVLRFTWRQLTAGRERVLVRLAQALGPGE